MTESRVIIPEEIFDILYVPSSVDESEPVITTKSPTLTPKAINVPENKLRVFVPEIIYIITSKSNYLSKRI